VKQLRDALQVQLIFHYLALIIGTVLTLLKIMRDYGGMDDHSSWDDEEQVQCAQYNYCFDFIMKIVAFWDIFGTLFSKSRVWTRSQRWACSDIPFW